MKVKELIAELEKQDPETEVYIEQGDQFRYMKSYSVKKRKLCVQDGEETLVVIEYT